MQIKLYIYYNFSTYLKLAALHEKLELQMAIMSFICSMLIDNACLHIQNIGVKIYTHKNLRK